MESKLIRSKYFLYLTEFFAGMSVMAVELGASRLMVPYFSSSQIVRTVIIGVIMIAMAIGNDGTAGWPTRAGRRTSSMPSTQSAASLAALYRLFHKYSLWRAVRAGKKRRVDGDVL